MTDRRALVVLAALFLAPAAATAQEPGRDRLEAVAASQAAQADRLLKAGQFAAALKLYRAERESRKALGDVRYEAYALRSAGCCLAGLKDDEAAIDAFKAARDLDAGRDDKGLEGFDGLLLARAELRLGRFAEAVADLERALPKLDGADDRDHECDARVSLVAARLALGEPGKAVADADRAFALAEGLSDAGRIADARLVRGLVARDLGKLDAARPLLEAARDAYREQGRTIDLAAAVRHLADLAYRLGRPLDAAKGFEEAAALHAKLGDPADEAEDRLDLASVRLDLGDVNASAREAALARDAFLLADDEADAIGAMVVLAQAQSRSKAKDALASAATTIRDALDRSARVHRDDPAERVRLLLLSADLEARTGRKPEATARLTEAARVADASGDPALRSAVAVASARHARE